MTLTTVIAMPDGTVMIPRAWDRSARSVGVACYSSLGLYRCFLALLDELLPVRGELFFVEPRAVSAMIARPAFGAFIEPYHAFLGAVLIRFIFG